MDSMQGTAVAEIETKAFEILVREHHRRLLGFAQSFTGDPAAAESWLRRSLEERQRASPDNPLRIAESQVEWGACLVQLGRYAEAEGFLLEAYRVFRSDGVAPAEAMARTSLRRLIALYEGWNKPARAAEYRSLLEDQE